MRKEVPMIVPTYINVNRGGIPAVRSLSVNVTATEVQFDFNNHRNVGGPFRGLIIINLAQAIPSGTTTTLPIIFTSEGANPIALTGYNGDAVIDGDGVPSFSTSSVYDPNNYYYYKEHGSYEGLVTLYIPYNYVMSTMGWNNASTYPTHIRGTLYAYLSLCAGNDSNGIIGNDFRTARDYGYGSPFYKIEVDSSIEVVQIGSGSYNKALAFTINVPKIEGDVVGYVYSAPVRTGAVLCGIFRKTVIS